MAIEEQTARTVFKGDGSTRAFPVTWYLDAEENIIVKMTNVTTAQVKTLELGTDYTVTPSDGEYPTNGAVINYPKNSVTPALGSDYRLTVIRNVPYTQNFVFPNNTRLLPKNIEGGLDGLELQIQQINDKADNAVSIPAGMDYDNEEFVAELFDKAKSAEQSAINAKASEANAKSSATNASQSAQTATTKAQEAKASATSASQSAQTATTKAQEAKASATSASQSAQTATTKANEAKASATSASQSAQTATTKAQEAISSATSAKKSETNAKASATNAKTSETNASRSAQTATTKANEASSSATNAKTSETNANSYKEQASLSAQTATTKANEASSSATNANLSATSAKTSEISASQSAQTATTKAQEASSSATNAKSSATSAKESEDKAQEYAERAENASSSVGNPVSNVTVDNNIITVTKGVGGSAYYTVDNVDNATHATTAGTADNATHATTAGTADSATKATQDGSGNTITTHYLSRNQSTRNDMNACTVEGIYRFSGTLSNAWTGTSWGTLLVFNNLYNGGSGVNNTFLVQIALPTDGRIWTRQRVNTGAWTSWNKLANTTDCTDTLKKVYPVGSIYMSTVSTNPATLFGFGTWEAMPAGRVLLAQGKSSWGTTYNAGSTGGEATHQLTVGELPAHNHSASTNTTGSHAHTYTWRNYQGWAGSKSATSVWENTATNNTGSAGEHSHTVTINNTGSNQSHNNLQPYIAVYMWKRTA